MLKGFMFRYRTVKFKLPRDCCPWCTSENNVLTREVSQLNKRVEQLEDTVVFDRSLAAAKLKMESALDLFERALKVEAGRGFYVSNPSVLTDVFSAAYAVVDGLVERQAGTYADREAVGLFETAAGRASGDLAVTGQNGHLPHETILAMDRKGRTDGIR